MEPDALISKVKGKLLRVSIGFIQELLRLSFADESLNPPFSRRDALLHFLERTNVEEIKALFTNQLSLEMLLLHSFVCKIFKPRVGKFDHVTKKDLQIMHHIICEYPMDLATLRKQS